MKIYIYYNKDLSKYIMFSKYYNVSKYIMFSKYYNV